MENEKMDIEVGEEELMDVMNMDIYVYSQPVETAMEKLQKEDSKVKKDEVLIGLYQELKETQRKIVKKERLRIQKEDVITIEEDEVTFKCFTERKKFCPGKDKEPIEIIDLTEDGSFEDCFPNKKTNTFQTSSPLQEEGRLAKAEIPSQSIEALLIRQSYEIEMKAVNSMQSATLDSFLCQRCGLLFHQTAAFRKHIQTCNGPTCRNPSNWDVSHDADPISVESSKADQFDDFGPSTSKAAREHQELLSQRNAFQKTILKKVFKCPYCSFWAWTISWFHQHLKLHFLNKQPFECSECAFGSKRFLDIFDHIHYKNIDEGTHQYATYIRNLIPTDLNSEVYNKHLVLLEKSREIDQEPKEIKKDYSNMKEPKCSIKAFFKKFEKSSNDYEKFYFFCQDCDFRHEDLDTFLDFHNLLEKYQKDGNILEVLHSLENTEDYEYDEEDDEDDENDETDEDVEDPVKIYRNVREGAEEVNELIQAAANSSTPNPSLEEKRQKNTLYKCRFCDFSTQMISTIFRHHEDVHYLKLTKETIEDIMGNLLTNDSDEDLDNQSEDQKKSEDPNKVKLQNDGQSIWDEFNDLNRENDMDYETAMAVAMIGDSP